MPTDVIESRNKVTVPRRIGVFPDKQMPTFTKTAFVVIQFYHHPSRLFVWIDRDHAVRRKGWQQPDVQLILLLYIFGKISEVHHNALDILLRDGRPCSQIPSFDRHTVWIE